MQDNVKKYKAVLEECLVECKKMLDFETEKRRALLDSDMNNLSAVLQSQQATMMKLENLVKKRRILLNLKFLNCREENYDSSRVFKEM